MEVSGAPGRVPGPTLALRGRLRRESMDGATRYDADELKDFCAGVFASLGMDREDARVVSDSLVRANLEGTDSHGISRLSIYARRIREGRILARPDLRVERNGSVLRVD